MKNLLENLKKYLEETPREKVLEEWAETAQWDNVGVVATEYFLQQSFTFTNSTNVNNNNFSSEFNSSSYIFALSL
ncbi:MAG: hypothetical protein SNG38_02720 [Rikenellaceae bacterium]